MSASRTFSLITITSSVVLLLGLSACHKKTTAVAIPTDSTIPTTASLPPEEKIGYASWYGDPYHGRRTSNGETYNKYGLTAAHRTLPFDTVVKVKNLTNGQIVKVRINDRGPFKENRIIDLSYAAAKEIGMLGPGTARVSLEVLEIVSNPFPLTIQVGSFKEKNNAEKVRKELQKHYQPVLIKPFESPEGRYFQVLVGEYKNQRLASTALRELKTRHYDGLIVRLDP
ncbi:MAG: septal ring lytic transglycosylase RlpA family lipoprotein [Acidobacteria bacterium]|nr:MAG: septal ring lytic transglycosylase RlpA family lipoprotein [Acidobacteriota bacterium]